jgi:hypothetical protein
MLSRAPGPAHPGLLSMPQLMSAWPALAYLLPALLLVSALYFLAKGNRKALAQLMALLACFVMGALLMEFFVFMAARMARSGSPQANPALGTGTLQLLKTMADPRSIAAPPLSLAAVAAYSVLLSYLWLLVTWVLHLRGKQGAGASRKKSTRAPRKAARA